MTATATRRIGVSILRIAYFAAAFALAATAHADGSVPGKGKIRGGEHPGFRRWVLGYALENRASIVEWWSGDLDGDGEADNVAELCLTHANRDARGFLVEDGRGSRYVAKVPARPCSHRGSRAPAFTLTDRDRIVLGRADEIDLALRDGQLVEIEHVHRHADFTGRDVVRFDDWDRLRHHDDGALGVGRTGSDANGWRSNYDLPLDEEIMLLSRGGDVTSGSSVLVNGEGTWAGAADAGFTVAVSQPDDQHLQVVIRIVDDVRVRAKARGEASLSVADHLRIHVGDYEFLVAQSVDGEWFWGEGPGLDFSGLDVSGDDTGVRLTFPTAWARFCRVGNLHDLGHWWEGSNAPIAADEIAVARLAVAYSDVDVVGGPARSVVATAPYSLDSNTGRRLFQYGLLVKLPHGDRWPVVAAPISPSK